MKINFYSIKKIMILCLLIFVCNKLHAEIDNDELSNEVKSKLNNLNGSLTNEGKDFWFSPPPAFQIDSKEKISIKIFVAAQIESEVTIEIGSKKYKESKIVKKYKVSEWEIDNNTACVYDYNPKVNSDYPADIYANSAIHVYSKNPIVVYVLVHQKYSSEGWCAIPTNGLGKSFNLSSYHDIIDNNQNRMTSISSICAAYDNTKITLKMGGDSTGNSKINTQTGKTISTGQTYSFTLNKGDVFAFMPQNNDLGTSEISGTTINSNKPISMVSAHTCAFIPISNTNLNCNYIVEANTSNETWGKSYPIPYIEGKTSPAIIRVLAKEDNTTIYRDSEKIAFIEKSSGVQGKAWFEFRLNKDNDPINKQVVIHADKPISVMYYNTAKMEDSVLIQNRISNPFMMNIVSTDQFVNIVTSITPFQENDSIFTNNRITLIYQKTDQKNNDLEWGEFVNNKLVWTKVDDKFSNSETAFFQMIDGKQYYAKNIDLPYNTLYQIKSKSNKFICYSYGSNKFASYGYANSQTFSSQDTKDTLCPTVNFAIDCHGNVGSGIITDQPFPDPDLIRANMAALEMNLDSSYNYNFDYEDFEVGTSTKVKWSLATIDPNKEAKAILTFTDKAGNDTSITILYFPEKIRIYNANQKEYLLFSNVSKNQTTYTQSIYLKNNSAKDVKIRKYMFMQHQHFTLDSLNFDSQIDLKAGEERKLNIVLNTNLFNDTQTLYQDTLILESDCSIYKFALSARTNSGAIIEVEDYDFSELDNADTLEISKTLTLRNIGNDDLIISGINGSDSLNQFSIDISNLNLPKKLAPFNQLTFDVKFRARKLGEYSAKFQFESNANIIDDICILKAKINSISSINEDGNTGNPILFTMSASPNPFGESTEVKYNLAGNIGKYVVINLVNSAGQKIETLVSQTQNPGEYSLQYNAKQLAQGTYYLIANVSGYSTQLPVIIAK